MGSSTAKVKPGSFGDDPIKFLDDKSLLAGDNVIIRPTKNLAASLLHLETAGRVNQAALNLINHKLLIAGDVGASPNIDLPVSMGGIGNVKRWQEKWQDSKLAQKHGVKRRDMPINVSEQLRRGGDRVIDKTNIDTYLNNNGLRKTHTVVKVRQANGFPQTQYWALPKREAQAVIEAGQRLPANLFQMIFRDYINAPFKGLFVHYNPSFAAYQLVMDTVTTMFRHGPMGLVYEVDELLGAVHLKNQDKWTKLHEEINKRVGEVGFYDRRSRKGAWQGRSTGTGDMPVNVNIRASGEGGRDFNQVFADVFSDELPLGIKVDTNKVTKLSDGSFTRGGGVKWDEINSVDGIKSLIASPLDSYQRMATKLEQAPRYAAARRVYKKTGDYDAAALAFKRATVDFQRGGVWTQAIDSFYAFANVAVQGGVLPYRIARDHPAQFWSTAGLAGIANMSMFLHNSTNESYWDIPLRDRLGPILVLDNSHMPINPATGRRNPYYVRLVPGAMREWSFIWAPQVMLQEQMYLMAKEKYGNPDMVIEGLLQVVSDMNPVAPMDVDADVYAWKENTLGTMGRMAASTGTVGLGTQVALENILNKNFFTNREVEPKWMLNLPLEQRYDSRTSELAKKVGPATGLISPIRLQNMLKIDLINDVVAMADLVMSATEVGASTPHVVVWAEEMYAEVQNMGDAGRKPSEIQMFVSEFLSEIPAAYKDEVMSISRKFADGSTVLGSTQYNTKKKHWPILNDFSRRFSRSSSGGSLRSTIKNRALSDAGISITQQRIATKIMSEQFHLRDELRWAR